MFNESVAVDTGTTKCFFIKKGPRGGHFVIKQPSAVAYNSSLKELVKKDDGTLVDLRLVFWGDEAVQRIGRHSDKIVIDWPIREGTIQNNTLTTAMFEKFLHAIRPKVFRGLRVLAPVSFGAGPNREHLKQCLLKAGASQVALLEEAQAAALGSGLKIKEAKASACFTGGGGTLEFSVFASGDPIKQAFSRTAGNALDNALIQHVKEEYRLEIGLLTAQFIKHQIGSACNWEGVEYQLEITGKKVDQANEDDPRLNEKRIITSDEVRCAMGPAVDSMVNEIKKMIESCSPEVQDDLTIPGRIILAGGIALLPGIKEYVFHRLGLNLTIPEDPQGAVGRGLASELGIPNWENIRYRTEPEDIVRQLIPNNLKVVQEETESSEQGDCLGNVGSSEDSPAIAS